MPGIAFSRGRTHLPGLTHRMKTDRSRPFHIVFYEGLGAAPLPPEALASLPRLLDLGYDLVTVRAGGQPPAGLVESAEERRFLVLGQFADTAPAASQLPAGVKLRDVTGLDAGAIVALAEETRDEAPLNRPGVPGAWKPWFPVIDYDRCTNCLQCLSFCLFDVYGVDEGHRIQVQNQDNCKTNCPACSRVCPEVAIMFPKYSAGPINGEPVSESDVRREKMKVDISSLLGGDIYSTLRTRSEAAKSRFSTERSADKALAERQKCLTKLQTDGLIPAEVLASIDIASLPSPDAIRRKAEEAAALAQRAREEPA